jgi:carboxyl-terminal processing protease
MNSKRKSAPASNHGVIQLLLLLLFTAPTTVWSQFPPEQQEANVRSFHEVWRIVRDTHWDGTLGGVDWEAAKRDFKPRVERAQNMSEVRSALRDMLNRLHNSHFAIHAANASEEPDPVLRAEARDGTSGLDVRVLADNSVVFRVAKGSVAEELGVRPGWCIKRISDHDLVEELKVASERFRSSSLLDYRLASVSLQHLGGDVGAGIWIDFLDASDRETRLFIRFIQRSGHKFTFERMPPRYVSFESRILPERIGYLTLNTWADNRYLCEKVRLAVKEFQHLRGVVIDLRGTRGGDFVLAPILAGFFITEKGHSLGKLTLRTESFELGVLPETDVFRGTVAVLVDGLSRSTSEVFASGLSELRRARVFGSRTAGVVQGSIVTRLANGDAFQHAIANFTTARGASLDGTGVKPDVEVRLTREMLLAKRDPVLEAAVSWIQRSDPDRPATK